jgi:hypothetical protein
MALTDEDQRLLDLLESSLRTEDPKLAAQFSSAKLGETRSVGPTLAHWVAAGVALLVGVGLLVVGMIVAWPISVAGFLVMLGAVAFAFQGGRSPESRDATQARKRESSGSGSASMKARMEQRWEARQDKGRE